VVKKRLAEGCFDPQFNCLAAINFTLMNIADSHVDDIMNSIEKSRETKQFAPCHSLSTINSCSQKVI
jgi:hypothetical protein